MALFIRTLTRRVFVSLNRYCYTRGHIQKVTGRCTTIFTRVVLLEFKQPSLEAWRYKIAVSAKWWSVVLPVVYTSGHVLGEKHM